MEYSQINKKELHIEDDQGSVSAFRTNSEGTITSIAWILDGERIEHSKEEQDTYKKIK